MTSPEIRVCAQCRHIRRKSPLDPFRHLKTWTAEQIELSTEWQEERRQAALQEEHRQRAGEEFDYEPETLAWCAAWTNEVGGVIDPVTGRKAMLYELCARRNARGDCVLFDRA